MGETTCYIWYMYTWIQFISTSCLHAVEDMNHGTWECLSDRHMTVIIADFSSSHFSLSRRPATWATCSPLPLWWIPLLVPVDTWLRWLDLLVGTGSYFWKEFLGSDHKEFASHVNNPRAHCEVRNLYVKQCLVIFTVLRSWGIMDFMLWISLA